MTVIAVVNKSKRVTSSEIKRMVNACNIQVKRDVAPIWDATPWSVKYYENKLPKNSISIVIFDNADEADTLGYHSETPDGKRYGRVFVNPILRSGGDILSKPNSVSVTLSHEVLEAFIDPDINLWAEDDKGRMWAYEICDPVEATSYRIANVAVSNFVTRLWFDSENQPGSKFDYLQLTKRAFQVLPDGYAVCRAGNQKEQIVWGKKYPKYKKLAKRHPAARTAQRHF
jgi:hypothetical protein